MGIVIKQLHKMDGYHGKHFGVICHNGHLCDAVLVGPYDRLRTLLHTEVLAEFELNEIVCAEVDLPRNDQRSGIVPKPGHFAAIDGAICCETTIDDSLVAYDVFFQNGPDFLTVTSEEIQAEPRLNSRIIIVGKGLHVIPLFTDL